MPPKENPRAYAGNAGASKTTELYQNRHGGYSDGQKDAISAAMPELLRKLGVENPEGGRPFLCPNPAHDDHHATNAFYYPDSQKVTCYTCGRTWDAADLAGLQFGITDDRDYPRKVQALEKILGRSFGEPVREEPFSYRRSKPEPYPAPDLIPFDAVDLWANGCVWNAYNALFEPEGVAAKRYLLSRGMDEYEAGSNLIGWCKHPSEIIPACNKFLNSANGWLVLPFYDSERGGVYYCMFRNLSDHKAKDMKPPNDSGMYPAIIYKEHLLKEQGITVHVTESIFDAISYYSLFDNANYVIGLNGSSGVNRLLGILAHADTHPNKIVVALDNDSEGATMAGKIKEGLSSIGIPCDVINPYAVFTDAKPPVKDANDLLQYIRKRGKYAE